MSEPRQDSRLYDPGCNSAYGHKCALSVSEKATSQKVLRQFSPEGVLWTSQSGILTRDNSHRPAVEASGAHSHTLPGGKLNPEFD